MFPNGTHLDRDDGIVWTVLLPSHMQAIADKRAEDRGQRTNGTSLMAGRHSLRGSFQSEAVVVCGDHFPTCLETTLIWSLTRLGSETPWTLGKE